MSVTYILKFTSVMLFVEGKITCHKPYQDF
jgi:hypothetical protein